MAFGTCIGAANALVQAASIQSPAGQYADQVNGAAAAAGPFWQATEVEARGQLMGLIILGDGGGTDLLAVRVGAAFDETAADTGLFVTAEPGADQHGLPANFGPGRGNWSEGDVARLNVQVPDPANAAVGAATTLYAVTWQARLVGDDVEIYIHNNGDAVVGANASVLLQYVQA